MVEILTETTKVEVLKDKTINVGSIPGHPPFTHVHVPYETYTTVKDDSGAVLTRACSRKFKRNKYLIYGIAGFSAIILTTFFINAYFPYPAHASCTVKWKFPDTCTNVIQKFRYEILNWPKCDKYIWRSCTCLSTLRISRSRESNVIKAILVRGNVQTFLRIKIAFTQESNSCNALAESNSNEWFMVFDHGANYCNLRGLVAATGFHKHPNFSEETSDAICTQFSMATCRNM